jgi:hypothetical protein
LELNIELTVNLCKTKFTIYNLQSIVVKEKLFNIVACNFVNNIVCKRKYKINKKILNICIKIEVQQKKKQRK